MTGISDQEFIGDDEKTKRRSSLLRSKAFHSRLYRQRPPAIAVGYSHLTFHKTYNQNAAIEDGLGQHHPAICPFAPAYKSENNRHPI